MPPDINRSQAEFAALKIIETHEIGPQVFSFSLLEKEDMESALITMEYIEGGNSLRQIDDHKKVSDESLGRFLAKIIDCGKQKIDSPLTPISSFLLSKLEDVTDPGYHGKLLVSDSEVEEARLLLKQFTKDSDIKTWVHGTLHPGNLIAVNEKIMTVDPRPFYGDYQYDVAELCLKWGSEKYNRRHNLADGITQFESLQQYIKADTNVIVNWMKILLATRA